MSRPTNEKTLATLISHEFLVSVSNTFVFLTLEARHLQMQCCETKWSRNMLIFWMAELWRTILGCNEKQNPHNSFLLHSIFFPLKYPRWSFHLLENAGQNSKEKSTWKDVAVLKSILPLLTMRRTLPFLWTHKRTRENFSVSTKRSIRYHELHWEFAAAQLLPILSQTGT